MSVIARYLTEAVEATCPLAIALVPHEMILIQIYNFLIEVPFRKENMPWCPCPFNKKHLACYSNWLNAQPF